MWKFFGENLMTGSRFRKYDWGKTEVGLAISGIRYPHHIASADTGRKLNAHKTFRKRSGRLLNILCNFSLCPVSTGALVKLFYD